MNRTAIGAGIGAVVGVLLLAGLGFWLGYNEDNHWGMRPGTASPWESGVSGALVMTVYYWWLAVGLGGMIGGLAALGSWLVRPKNTFR